MTSDNDIADDNDGGSSTVLWGKADDGAHVRIEILGDFAGDTAEWWPVMGLAHVRPETLSDADAHTLQSPTASYSAHAGSEAGWDRLESDLALFTSERLSGLVAVHAGVICAEGRLIVVPGPSFAGKTTLCSAALDAGYEVRSDEYALVDPATGLVVGYPRRLRIRRADGGADRRPAHQSPAPQQVDLVAQITFNNALPEGVNLEVTEMTPGDTALALLANTVCASSRPREAFDAAVAVARRCRGVTGARGDASAALAELVLLATDARATT